MGARVDFFCITMLAYVYQSYAQRDTTGRQACWLWLPSWWVHVGDQSSRAVWERSHSHLRWGPYWKSSNGSTHPVVLALVRCEVVSHSLRTETNAYVTNEIHMRFEWVRIDLQDHRSVRTKTSRCFSWMKVMYKYHTAPMSVCSSHTCIPLPMHTFINYYFSSFLYYLPLIHMIYATWFSPTSRSALANFMNLHVCVLCYWIRRFASDEAKWQ